MESVTSRSPAAAAADARRTISLRADKPRCAGVLRCAAAAASLLSAARDEPASSALTPLRNYAAHWAGLGYAARCGRGFARHSRALCRPAWLRKFPSVGGVPRSGGVVARSAARSAFN
ncbi:MAG: hypothetical protein LBS96_07660 [Oscillospiraceae bacterium]|nr:hypothetical protein [Oscillospiraceae bacterium]